MYNQHFYGVLITNLLHVNLSLILYFLQKFLCRAWFPSQLFQLERHFFSINISFIYRRQLHRHLPRLLFPACGIFLSLPF
uniref:Putative secreted protein n=1 Tax=Xenopsylla cheopis TaxID=163159 RepID=A0A6M2DVY0_XENCH